MSFVRRGVKSEDDQARPFLGPPELSTNLGSGRFLLVSLEGSGTHAVGPCLLCLWWALLLHPGNGPSARNWGSQRPAGGVAGAALAPLVPVPKAWVTKVAHILSGWARKPVLSHTLPSGVAVMRKLGRLGRLCKLPTGRSLSKVVDAPPRTLGPRELRAEPGRPGGWIQSLLPVTQRPVEEGPRAWGPSRKGFIL